MRQEEIVVFSPLSCNPSSTSHSRHAIFERFYALPGRTDWQSVLQRSVRWKDAFVFCRVRPYILLTFLGLLFFGDLVLHPSEILYADHSDLLAMHLPMKRFLVRSWQETGEIPLWNPYSFGGMPFVHDVQGAAFYPLHLPLYLLPEELVGVGMSWLVAIHVILAGGLMFAYARYRGLGPAAALVAGIGFMFAGKWLLHVLAGGHYI